MFIVLKSQLAIIFGLCAFLGFLSFKPSEPYLSQYLICELNTQEDYCSGFDDQVSCMNNVPCSWVSEVGQCSPTSCSSVNSDDCGNSDYDYCTKASHNTCEDAKCYKNFTEDEVNDEIYPWSTYAYLPFLMVLGPGAELFSYRMAILVGICGRLVTRFLLLYGKSIAEMQWMQVSYAFGTAAEDVLSAYVFYTLSPAYYQLGTSYIKATSLVTNMAAGIVGDLLVVEGDVSLRVLMWISAATVCVGFLVGVLVIQAPHVHTVHGSTGVDGSSGAGVCEENSTTNPITASTHSTYDESPPTSPTPLKPSNRSPNTTIDTTANPTGNTTTAPITFKEKLRLFREQLVFLRMAARSRTLAALLLYWVVGNAVFSTLYDYEVAIYAELNGSNEWNGSVLAVMLVAGTVGALLPTWLKHDVYDASEGSSGGSSASSSGNDCDSSRHALNSSVGGLASESSAETNTNTPTNTPPPTVEKTFTATPEFVVGMRIIVAGVLSCVNLLLFVLTWEVVSSVAFMALFFATWQYINVVTFARLALALKVAQVECTIGTSTVDTSAAGASGVGGEGAVNRQLSSDLLPHTLAALPRLSVDTTHRTASRNISTEGISLHNPLALHTNHTSTTHHDNTHTTDSSNSNNTNTDTTSTLNSSEIPDPPYSMALVAIIALNVVVQIVLQAVTFSGLALPLRTSCYIFVLVFCVATVVYVCMLVVLFGTDRMRAGLRSVVGQKK